MKSNGKNEFNVLFYKYISDKFRHPVDRYSICAKYKVYIHNALLDYKLKNKKINVMNENNSL